MEIIIQVFLVIAVIMMAITNIIFISSLVIFAYYNVNKRKLKKVLTFRKKWI